MKPNEIVDIVEKLNGNLYDSCPYLVENYGLCFTYKNIGWVDFVDFLDMQIWNSDCDPRDYDEDRDEYEDLEGYLRNTARAILDRLEQILI